MASRSSRNRLGESANIWPGFVDVLATLLIVIIFVLMVFTVSQIYLSDAISGRDKALQELRTQISELSKILQTEIGAKEQALQTLTETETTLSGVQQNLREQELISEGLQTDLAKKSTEIFVQEQNIIALSDQITELLSELRIVAKALEVYEGLDSAILSTDGLGQRINKALAARVDQLKTLNVKLEETNKKLSISEDNLNENISELNLVNEKLANNEKILQSKIEELKIKNENLLAINDSLGIEDGGIVERFLSEILDLPWDQVYVETKKWENVLSSTTEDAMLKILGNPKTGLFGNPIPYSNYFEGPMDRLCDVDTNKKYSIIKISEELKRDSSVISFLERNKILPGNKIYISNTNKYSITVSVTQDNFFGLDQFIAKRVFVS